MFKFYTDTQEFGKYIWDFVRYSAGRQTYAPSICESIMKANAHIILDPWRALIVGKIESAYARCLPKMRACEAAVKHAKAIGDPDAWEKGYKFGELGQDFDAYGWIRAVRKLEESVPDREIVETFWDGEDAIPVIAEFDDVDDFWFMVGSAIRIDIQGGDDMVFSPAEHTAFIKAHNDILNEKWVDNLMRDIMDDFNFMFHDGTEPDEWAELSEFLDSHPNRPSYQWWRKEYDPSKDITDIESSLGAIE
jgi:hypothetical protein